MNLGENYNSFYNHYIKRLLDIIISLSGLIILSPLLIIITVFQVIESGTPIFYRAERGGYNNHSFKILKFRSMVVDADKIGGGTTALNDPRITKLGRVLRKTKLDELPQLFQVLNGKMSLIGPRPELLHYTNMYEGEELLIFKVRPGITDYSSIEFINLDEIVGNENADKMYEKYVLKRKNQLRIKYARTVSFKTDCYILFKTMYRVIKKIFRFAFKDGER